MLSSLTLLVWKLSKDTLPFYATVIKTSWCIIKQDTRKACLTSSNFNMQESHRNACLMLTETLLHQFVWGPLCFKINTDMRYISTTSLGKKYMLFIVGMEIEAADTHVLVRADQEAMVDVSLHQAGLPHALLSEHHHFGIHTHRTHVNWRVEGKDRRRAQQSKQKGGMLMSTDA